MLLSVVQASGLVYTEQVHDTRLNCFWQQSLCGRLDSLIQLLTRVLKLVEYRVVMLWR